MRPVVAGSALLLWLAPLGVPTAASEGGGEPVEFRCDSMIMLTRPNRGVCRGHVVIRRGDVLVCCDVFEGTADEAWAWQRFTCTSDVRAQRGIETVWAQRADFVAADNDLVLTGRPLLHRGDSMLEGERITVDVKEALARIAKPRGRLDLSDDGLPKRPAPLPAGPLPSVCPLPAMRH